VTVLRSLWWAVRSRRAVGPDETPLPYSDRFTVMLWAVSGLGALEVGVVHVLTAGWPLLRWSLFAVGVCSLVVFLAFGLSLRQHPHLLRDDELVLRFGTSHSVRVPLERLRSVTSAVESGHRRNLVLADDRLTMAVMGDSNVELCFDPPAEVAVKGRTHLSARLSFWVDDPRGVVRQLRSRVRDETNT
jgi:hypothetical protein